jgi:hypothetical protein
MQQSVLLLIEVKNMKNNKKYAVITFIVVGVFYVIMFIVTLIERNSNKIISPAETRDSSIYIIILACSPIVLMICMLYKYIDRHKYRFKYFADISDEVLFSKNNRRVNEHSVLFQFMVGCSNVFVVSLDKKSKIIIPAVYTKKNNKISMINRNAEYTVFEHIDFSDTRCPDEYTFIRACKIRDIKTGEQVLFVAVPNRKTDILAYSDSTHIADKSVTFGKFRIFCFIEPTDKPNTDLYVNMQKIHLEKTKRKGMYFIGLDEVTKTKSKSKK